VLPQRVLVLGVATGLGRRLAVRLGRHADFDVLGADREAPPEPLVGVSLAVLGGKTRTSAHRSAVHRLLLDFSPHTVVFLSPWHDAQRCEAAPVACAAQFADAVRATARGCLGLGIRLVVHSSDLVFGGASAAAPAGSAGGGLFAETDRPAPATLAGRQHLAAENAARGAGFHRWAVVRTGPLYATGDADDPLARAASGEATPFERAHAALARPYTHADEAAAGLERLLRHGAHGLYHVAGHEALPPAAFATLARSAAGLPPLAGGTAAATRATALLTLRAETELGWRTTHRLGEQVKGRR